MIRHCEMAECEYYKNGECKPCIKCKTKKFKINDTCERCIDCETKPGVLRWEGKYDMEIKAINSIFQIIYDRLYEIEQEMKEEMKEEMVKVR